MIHKLGTVILTLIIITIVGYVGLTLIRQFAFSIALENHEANAAMDSKAEKERKLKIALADQAASDAFRKVEPLIQSAGSGGGGSASNESMGASKSGSMEEV
jgi:hypothetical protein